MKSFIKISQSTFTSPWKQKLKFTLFIFSDLCCAESLAIMGESANSSKLKAFKVLFPIFSSELYILKSGGKSKAIS